MQRKLEQLNTNVVYIYISKHNNNVMKYKIIL